MQPPKFLIGKHPAKGVLWAAVDGDVNFLEPRVAGSRFGGYLAPFRTEQSAREALLAAGAVNIEIEQRKRRG
jgi:hypothetical protein